MSCKRRVKGKHASDKAAYASYKSSGRFESNKIKKLERILNEQPKNTVVEERLSEVKKNGVKYSRNRKPIKAGEFKSRYPTLDVDSKKQLAYERKNTYNKIEPWKLFLLEIKKCQQLNS